MKVKGRLRAIRSIRVIRVPSAGAVLALLLGAFSANVSAHRLDEYLQATLIAIETHQIQVDLDLTPGAEVADGIFAMMDLNHDGAFSAKERAAYARTVVDSLSLTVDGRPRTLTIDDVRYPTVEEMRRGEGVIRLRVDAQVSGIGPGPHRLSFSNHHRTDIGAYLVNALVPTDERIHITGQSRDMLQRDFAVEFSVSAGQSNSTSSGLPILISAAMATTMLFFARRTVSLQ